MKSIFNKNAALRPLKTLLCLSIAFLLAAPLSFASDNGFNFNPEGTGDAEYYASLDSDASGDGFNFNPNGTGDAEYYEALANCKQTNDCDVFEKERLESLKVPGQ